MPKEIQTNYFPQPPLDGVLIKQDTIRKNYYFRRLEQQARQRAKEIIKDAQIEAQELQKNARREGFQQGMLTALQQIATYLSDSNRALAHWQKKLDKQVREVMSVSVNHPETLMLVLDEWLSGINTSECAVHILFPVSMKHIHSEIAERLNEEWGGMIYIEFHSESTFVFRCGDDIAEFSPVAFIDAGSCKIMKESTSDMNMDCKSISRESVENFITYCRTLTD
ncbi:hypothetical protein NW381_001359 [Salmonella enterica]|nr:hypothetical protein [Salmonella enterica subsp. enterica serovar Freetown]EBN9932866.1 hypothetical protein [Salmonella enterica]EDV9774759.1 hypothetical protein [Salmonella enterica subsp. enterica serovar Poona]EBH8792744.1 hypothetical protein [Salmonella enterica subsp. enterica serovar Freetown]EBP0843367.1 hypothetical protein [Salmonella enterica]